MLSLETHFNPHTGSECFPVLCEDSNAGLSVVSLHHTFNQTKDQHKVLSGGVERSGVRGPDVVNGK